MVHHARRCYVFSNFAINLYLFIVSHSCASGARLARTLQQSTTAVAEACPNSLTRVGCAQDPCMRYPCPNGQIGTQNNCGTCHCTCSPDSSSTITSITDNVTGITAATAYADQPRAIDVAVQETQHHHLLFPYGLQQPDQLIKGNNQSDQQCPKKYQSCTCSAACCGTLVCGFPTARSVGLQESAAANTTAAAGLHTMSLSNSTSITTNSSSNATISSLLPASPTARQTSDKAARMLAITAAPNVTVQGNASAGPVVAGVLPGLNVNNAGAISDNSSSTAGEVAKNVGPTCRTLDEIDLRTGVVNYGC